MKESVAINTVMDKSPTAELDQTLTEFVSPFTRMMPEALRGYQVETARAKDYDWLLEGPSLTAERATELEGGS